MSKARPLAEPLKIKEVLRFWGYVERGPGCWEWRGKYQGRAKSPTFCVQGRHYSPRRVAWELTKSGRPLPKTKKLWATCRNTHCVNPAHMAFEKPLQKKCKRGHWMSEKNVYVTTQGKRTCRRCLMQGLATRKLRYIEEGRGWGRSYTAPKRRKRKKVA